MQGSQKPEAKFPATAGDYVVCTECK